MEIPLFCKKRGIILCCLFAGTLLCLLNEFRFVANFVLKGNFMSFEEITIVTTMMSIQNMESSVVNETKGEQPQSMKTQSIRTSTQPSLSMVGKEDRSRRTVFPLPEKSLSGKTLKILNVNYNEIPERYSDDISIKHPEDNLNDTIVYNVPDASKLQVNLTHSPANNSCDGLKLVVVLKSRVSNTDVRHAIRRTWASIQNQDNTTKVIFALGLPKANVKEVTVNITKEATLYDDIIQGSFLDDYFNVTVKTVMMLRWIYESCKRVQYILFGDDDAYIDLKDLMHSFTAYFESADALSCGDHLYKNSKAKLKGKWMIPKNRYKLQKYPNYCNGLCYMMTHAVARKLYKTSRRTHTDLAIDDMLITGLVRVKAQVKINKSKKPVCVHLNATKGLAEEIQRNWKSQKQAR